MSAVLAADDQRLVAFAEEIGTEGPIAMLGSRTRWQTGGPVAPDARLVAAPTGIVDYVPDEMTVTVRAGTTVADLHAALAEKGQRTGLPERGGTVGGGVAVGENTMYVLGRGRVREAVLQVRYVDDQGRLVSAGGPTVKNVTGFDLPRLMTGALGTLGCLAELILRTNPIPAVSRWVRSDDADPFAALDTVLRPSAVLWDGVSTWVQLEGHAPTVAAEQQRLTALGSFAEVEGPPDRPSHRWSLRPAAVRDFDPTSGPFVASVGVGTVWASAPQPARPTDPVVAALAARVKEQFDPAGRFNPGRAPGAT